MLSIVIPFSIFVFLIVLAVFFWFWWVGPRDQVPPYLAEADLRRIEVQDRVRQTNYQVLTALGLGATFLTTLFQFVVSSQHWRSEFESRSLQERTAKYVEAVKQLDQGSELPKGRSESTTATDGAATNVAGIRTLYLLGTQNAAEYHEQSHNIISNYAILRTRGKTILRDSQECRNDYLLPRGAFEQLLEKEKQANTPADREEAAPGVQSAMAALGDRKFAGLRLHDEGSGCTSDSAAPYKLKIEHAILDDLDLSQLDLSCSLMSQSKFRRVSLNGANLASADLRGARLADYDIPGSPAALGTIGDRLYRTEVNAGPPEWKRYRCWITDLRGANLSNANLEGAALDGADLTNADLTNANLCRTDISRANFTGAKGLNWKMMLEDACAGPSSAVPPEFEELAQPVGLAGFPKIRRCGQYTCQSEIRRISDEQAAATETGPAAALYKLEMNGQANLALFALLALAGAAFYGVGYLAERRWSEKQRASSIGFPSRFPEKSLSYSSELFNSFLGTEQKAVDYYRWPILFPLDLIVMILLTTAMGAASWYWFAASGCRMPVLAVVLPLSYFLADLAEDIRLFRLLVQPNASTSEIAALKKLTRLKFVTIIASMVQTAAALVTYLWSLGLRLP